MDEKNTHKHKNFLTMGLMAGAIVGIVGAGIGITLEDVRILALSPVLGIVVAGAGLMIEAVSVQERVHEERLKLNEELKEKYAPRIWEEIKNSISTVRDKDNTVKNSKPLPTI